MRYLGKDEYRMLTAVEMGMRNHELVPVELIVSIAKLRHGGAHKILSTLLRFKLLSHENQSFDGYRLTYQGYDILALKTLLSRNVIASVGAQIGIGKESDIFEAKDEHENELVLKIHRLGRTSFRAVRSKRDYLAGKSKTNWLYMSRLAALKEFAFMQALYAHGFPVPVPIDHNRHIVAMSRVAGFPMAQIKSGNMEGADVVFKSSLNILRRLAQCGLVHCDFNEFNLMVNPENGQVTLIDFPQMVSTNHHNAQELFSRDLHGLVKFFAMKMKYHPCEEDTSLTLDRVPVIEANLDMEVQAAGFTNEDGDALMGYLEEKDHCEKHHDDDKEDEKESQQQTVFQGIISNPNTNDKGGDSEQEGHEIDNHCCENENDSDDVSELGSGDEAPEDMFHGDDSNGGDVKKVAPLTGEELDRAREDARMKMNRKNSTKKGGGGGHGQGAYKKKNSSKDVTKYGKKIHKERIDYL